MAKNIWDDEEPFMDGAPAFENGQWKEPDTYTPAPDNMINAEKIKEARALAAQQPIEEDYDLDELTEQVSQDDDDDDFTEVLSDARLRLEQGKLYEMVMNHGLFDGVEADPRAAKSVQKQIRKFAKEQMEIMLGMRQEQTLANNAIVSSPFNDLEVTILKKLASAASKGATESEEAQVQTPTPVQAQPQKKKTLNSIGNKPQAKPQPKSIQKRVEPIQRTAKPKLDLPPEFEPDYEPLSKPVHKMTAAELAERDRQAAERQKARTSAMPANRAPYPDYATREMLAMSQANRATGGAGMSAFNGKLSQLIINNQIKKS